MQIEDEYICRTAFRGEIAPLYCSHFYMSMMGMFMYFLSTKYGINVQHFKQNSFVTVEVDNCSPDHTH